MTISRFARNDARTARMAQHTLVIAQEHSNLVIAQEHSNLVISKERSNLVISKERSD
ncbi:hypothetical protein [Thermosynechococcus sp. HY593]|uniref:hypothetical protein n=1 Tax=Thermosynechococcus sp. HY593 TaxID=3074103 RepID=UPI0028780E2D|nr:hypothetical protein [Thermosynechococcus sp. HY593]WNC64830.1 hypothetical protein RHK28_10025 [Thermosynechococcus sp. HY593]